MGISGARSIRPFFSTTMRNEEDIESQRLGLRHVIDASSDLLLSVIFRDFHQTQDEP